jgi:hypothetical protein
VADHDDLGPAGLRLRQIERDDSIRRQCDEKESRSRQDFETAVARYVNQQLARMSLDDCDADERSAVMATLADIARERLSGRTDGYASKLFGGRPLDTLEQFRSQRERLLERIAQVQGETEMFRRGGTYCTGAQLAEELAREALMRLTAYRSSRAGLFELLERVTYEEMNLRSVQADRISQLRTPFVGGIPTGGGPTAPMSYGIRGAGYAELDTHGLEEASGVAPNTEQDESAPKRTPGRPGRPPGSGLFPSDEDACETLTRAVRALTTPTKQATKAAVCQWLMKDEPARGIVTEDGIDYWVKVKLGYPDWRAFRDGVQ